MYWTKDHDLLLVREVLTVDPYSQPKGSRERAKLWEEIALNLSAVSEPRFSVSVRSVRDRVNLVLIKKHKRKVAEESKASGIAVDEPSEFDAAIEEICEKAEAAQREQQMISEGKKTSAEKEKKQAEDMRAKALEKVGETRKRVVGDDVREEPEKKGEKNKEIWSRNHSISEGEVGKRIQNQARRVRTKEAGAVCPSKVARRNDTATDPSTGAAANNVC